MRIVAVDIGGTHARFALADLAEGQVALQGETVLKTSDYESFDEAWRAFVGPRRDVEGAAVAIAAPVMGTEIKLTNNRWVLRPAGLAEALGVGRVELINDFAAVAYAVPICAEWMRPVCGPDRPLELAGMISIVGPGTGLGVAMLLRGDGGDRVIPSEGGHIGFAPADTVDDAILARLRGRYGRGSAERVVCGRGLAEIHAVLTGEEADDRSLWQRALANDPLLAPALDRYCGLLGAIAGDLALAQGAAAVVIAGGLGLRLGAVLPGSSFAERFADKGRFRALMEQLPVRLITHQQPGLLGAAAAFAAAPPA